MAYNLRKWASPRCGQHKHVFVPDLSHSSLACIHMTIYPSRIHIFLKDITLQGNISLNAADSWPHFLTKELCRACMFGLCNPETLWLEVQLYLDDTLIPACFWVQFLIMSLIKGNALVSLYMYLEMLFICDRAGKTLLIIRITWISTLHSWAYVSRQDGWLFFPDVQQATVKNK